MNATKQIMQLMESLPEGTARSAKELLHLANRATVDQALSRLVRRGKLLRVGRGIYIRPEKTRFGSRPPSPEIALKAFAAEKGETVVPHGAAAANALGLTTQVPTRMIYLTSGPSRRLNLGKQTIELRHAPSWQLCLPKRPAGDAVRALAWIGEEKAATALRMIGTKLSKETRNELMGLRSRLPTWMAQEISTLAMSP